nr:hypothetical protein CPGR_03162 [Mycolicibacter nonchromogenicus]
MVLDVDGQVAVLVSDQHIGKAFAAVDIRQTSAGDHLHTGSHRRHGALPAFGPVGLGIEE